MGVVFLSVFTPIPIQSTTTHSNLPIVVQNLPILVTTSSKVTTSTEKWIIDLRWCESRNHDDALNPVDVDGTPSKGRFQFKDTTFYNFARIYKIKVTSVWNGDEQEIILRRMIKDKSVNLAKQFPDCVRKLGLPD